ncbi:MAG: hypothetical protein AAB426_03405 [Myxococcota bacterium]
MSSTRRMSHLAPSVAAGLMALACACGNITSSADATVRVTVEGTRDLAFVEVEDDGTVELEGDVTLDRALVRIGALEVTSDEDATSLGSPINLDLFARTIVWEGTLAGTRLTQLSLAIPMPNGDGVVRGAPISVFLSGLLFGEPFEYRDASMDPFTVALSAALGSTDRELDIRFELRDLFIAVEEDTLVEDALGGFVLDATHNSAAAAQVEAALRASVSVAVGAYARCPSCAVGQ